MRAGSIPGTGKFFPSFFYDDDSEAKRERRHAGISAANAGASIV